MVKKTPDARHVQVALHHANILEERKRIEADVLDAIIMLLDFPSAPHGDAKRPSASDAQRFAAAVSTFQPADYDALIEERNLCDKCGYALCRNPKKKARSTARKQFVDTERGVEIVDRKVLEVWCSDDCAKRALYVKVQLKEEPAWLRQGGLGGPIELMVDNAEEHATALPRRPTPDAPDEHAVPRQKEDELAAAWAAQEEALADLALERGEQPGQPAKATTALVKGDIVERDSSNAPPRPPRLLAHGTAETTMAIEGHIPRQERQPAADGDQRASGGRQSADPATVAGGTFCRGPHP